MNRSDEWETSKPYQFEEAGDGIDRAPRDYRHDVPDGISKYARAQEEFAAKRQAYEEAEVKRGVVQYDLHNGPPQNPIYGTSEIRVTDPTTGGEKGSKLARFSLIPQDFLWALAEHYGRGARKYADRNWERGYKWSLTVDAMQRHFAAWIQGEDDDPETGSSHLIAVAWHVVALWWFHRHQRGTDDVRRGQE